MKSFEIKVDKREKLGKKETKELRKQNLVPCVMYGGDKNHHFFAHENLFNKIVYSPDVFLIKFDISGEKHSALMQEIQFHPVTDKIIHIDFIEVSEDKPVVASIPILLTGSSIGIKNGGKLRQRRRYLKVTGLIKDMPEKLEIDLSLIDIGDVVKVGDLDYKNLEILDPHRSMVVSVVSSRVSAKGMEAGEDEITESTESEESETASEENAESSES